MERIGLTPGTEIGGYRVLGPIGSGGMGAVYRALDADGAAVALKMLHPHLTTDPEARARLEREVASLRRIRHPGVARVLDAEIDSTEAFVVTELISGTDLAARVRDRGPLAGPDLADLAEGLRAALAEVHAAGVVHRDLTPGNVMVTGAGPVLIDFGVAQDAADPRMTSAGFVVGTPGYLAPEVLDGAEPSVGADWWGWAAVLAFAATGRPPFGPGPTTALLARVRAGDPDLAGLPAGIAAALAGALARDPGERTSPGEVTARLRRPGDADAGDERVPETAVLPLAAVPATVAMPIGPGEDAASGARTEDSGDDAGAGAGADDAGPDDPDEWDGADEDGADDPDEWDGADEGDAGGGGRPWDPEGEDPFPEAPGVWVPPEPAGRIGTALALAAPLVALGATRPVLALLVAVGLAVLARSVGLTVDSYHRHRHDGERRGERTRSVLAWPWALLRGAVGLVPSVLVAASVMVIAIGVAWWLLAAGTVVIAAPGPGEPAGEIPGNAVWVPPVLLAGAVALGLVTLWFGPTARATRVGARWVLGAVAPGRGGAGMLALVALAAATVLVTVTVLGLETTTTQWWPLPQSFDLG